MRWLALVLALLPTCLAAQICPSRDVVLQYELARDAKDPAVVLVGEFQEPSVSVARTGAVLRFSGKMLISNGFDRPFTGQVRLVRACVDQEVPCDPATVPWGPHLVFARNVRGNLVVFESICGEQLIQRPDPSELRRLVACHQGKTCLRPGQ